ncbi:hypothetical protein D0809_06445 [Flavobacterium circumlabens]|uniref:Short subunit dehydrogenase-like uncharacterized protein n=1 Tax=Flavobacterium circumlabens TaxID=2133765 RepID=A0A4Y7UF38_9FLAO|nr:saccharopine dehydrogenase NADP-binding domain-containing protein [Flavobacterium circumlabens]TCN59539.1 short subunit dehydrogenase-like uncharacterized protein [Flavobacterium circumlabens]TEB44831.1 hypothetical protein D0809_06445 [Flavobacterium circumlabens]
MKDKILIYGAAGYMGRLFTQHTVLHKLPIILGGRSTFKTDMEYRIFSLDHPVNVCDNLHDILVVVNLAGPFANTNKTLVEACISTKTHYIDISGEVTEMKAVFEFHERAVKAGIMLMPGAGFGVVPTDIVANLAKNKMPTANQLKIAYSTEGSVSRGTLKTVLKDINKEGVVLKDGKFAKKMPAATVFSFKVLGKNKVVVYNPWRADLFTAQLSTGIQNIETYSNFPGIIVKMMQGKMLWIRDFILKRLIKALPDGPSMKQLQKGKTFCFAEIKNENGEKTSVTLIGPEAYLFTALTLIEISKRILQNDLKIGFQTPNIYGFDLIKNIENVKLL